MSRVCVLIGEGKSEKSFLASLLVSKFGFEPLQTANCIKYRKITDTNLFWLLPSPSLGITHCGGKEYLKKKDAYLISNAILSSGAKDFGAYPEIYYYILTDGDNENETQKKQRAELIKNTFLSTSATHKEFVVCFAKQEIESWFLAGTDITFPYLVASTSKVVNKIQTDPESYRDPKEILDTILVGDVSGNRQRIATDYGEHLQVDLAKSRSPSFKYFIDSLLKNNLL